MSSSGDYRPFPATFEGSPRPPGAGEGGGPAPPGSDPRVPLLNLSMVRARMDSLQHFLSESVRGNALIGQDQMDMVSSEISTAIHHTIVNGSALLACFQTPAIPNLSSHTLAIAPDPDISVRLPASVDSAGDEDVKIPRSTGADEGASMDLKVEGVEEEMGGGEWEIRELDAVELLAEHVHFCDVCGKGFKRDANLRMHMRAHGNQFKTPEALARPPAGPEPRRPTRFSCPFSGCNRNRSHGRFRPLKSVICVKNHFKRSHCPKMYSCNRCNKKSFSVVADLKSHLKHCGESRWRCSCGTNFSRKDKLFGHMALFEGHMPAVVEEDEKGKGAAAAAAEVEDEEDEDEPVKEIGILGSNFSDTGLFEGLLEGFGSVDNYCLQDILDSANEFRSF